MSFFLHTWLGIRQELLVYKKEPKILLYKNFSLILSVIMTSINGSVTDLSEAATNNALWQISMFLSSSSVVLYKLASERQDNFKDFLLINGMTKAAYQAKIAASCYIEVLLVKTLYLNEHIINIKAAVIQALTIYLNYHQALSRSASYMVLEIMVILLISGIATMNMCFLLSEFFTPKTASAAGSFFLFLLGLLYFIATSFGSLPVYLLASLQPNAGLALALNSLFPSQNDGGITGTQIYWDGYSSFKGSLMMMIGSCAYLALYLYIERDKDVDYKQLEKLKLKKAKESYISLSLLQNSGASTKAENEDVEVVEVVQNRSAIPSNFEKLPDGLKLKKTIETVNLKKAYKDCVAVEDVSLSIFEQEIFCLLGHNGAGKTTLVNMLTGLIPKTSGTFYYNGEEVFLNLEKIRGNVGFCPQKDFLLMHDSVYDNLKFFAEIKKISHVRMESEIERVMTQLGLLYFKDMPARSLSGGFKRKLSIGIALINNPKIIIMDEPTSGMDPVSRRAFWDIIQELKKENKTVIFTTQILDEAEVLADRVAIMSKGNLFAMGSPDFIKKKFGSGYTLSLNDKESSMEILSKGMEITQRVHRIIPAAIRNYDAAPNILEYTLPFSEQRRFAELFAELEGIKDVQINLRMTTLEEVFVGLELDEDLVESKEGSGAAGNNEGTQTAQNIPAGFFKDKAPSFVDLLMAVIVQKKYTALRNKAYLLVTWLPILFMVVGIALSSRLTDQKAGAQNIILILLFGNSFMMNTFTTPPATERLQKISHILRAMGLKAVPYWVGNLISDFIIKGIECSLLISTILICNVSYLSDNMVKFSLLYFAFSFNMITKAYNISMEYKTLTAIVSAGPFYLIGGTLLPQFISSILYAFFRMNALGALYIISAVLFGPAVLLQLGFHTLLPSTIDDAEFAKNMPFKQTWVYIAFAAALGVIELLRVLWADSKAYELKETMIYNQNETPSVQMPIDHVAIGYEKTRVSAEDNEDPIKAIDVQKIYPNGFKALDDLTFGVERGQIFCLLGPNGAGKTTAFEILTSKIPKTSGTVKLEGKELSRELYDIFNETGICPQSNTLWESLTVEEHLRIYAHIKGLSSFEADEAINYLLEAIGLVEYRERPAEKLSGGNKRKLCVGISMIGAPKLMFMDEPSTGMDPLARNKLWNLIKNVMKDKRGTMVLTTHYMQEAELVGNKLGMLINGRFAIMGTLGELKKKFGEYTIAVHEIEKGFSSMQIEILIQSVLPRIRRHMAPEEKGVVFKVPCDAMNFSGVFQMLEEMKTTKQIKDFSIYTTTLEQIFIKLAKLQRRRE